MSDRTRFGQYGGQYVPEILMHALQELEEADTVIGRPIDPLAEGTGIANAEVTRAAWGEGRQQDTGGAPGSSGHGRRGVSANL